MVLTRNFFCGTDVEFIDSEILALIKPDRNSSFIFSLPVFVFPLFYYVFQPPSTCTNHRAPLPSPTSSRSPAAAAVISPSNPPSLSPSAHDWAALLDPPVTLPSAAPIFDLAAQFLRVPLSCGGVGALSGSSQEQPGAVTSGKSVIMLHTKAPYRALCCDLIRGEVGKVRLQTAHDCNVQWNSNVLRREKFEVGIYFQTPR